MKRNGESGQVLLIGMIAMIIILLAVFLLFDLGNVIRAKVKAQNAVDAAALVGANWQRHTLNLVGELNLVKATTVLISDDLFGIGESPDSYLQSNTQAEYDRLNALERYGRLKTASDTLSQMQQRALFIVPLIGFGAAQQAAKNNGLNYNPEFADALLEQLNMARGTGERSSLYTPYTTEEFVKTQLFGYDWQPSYTSLLSEILQEEGDDSKGIAVVPNGQLLGAPRLRGSVFASVLQTRRLYDAIDSSYWCWLKDILKMSFSAGKWWGDLVLDEDNSFKRESEFLPVNVEIKASQRDTLESLDRQGILEPFLTEAGWNAVPLSRTHDGNDPVYDAQGNIASPDSRDNKLDPLPVIDWAWYGWKWRDYDSDLIRMWEDYLTSPFQTQARYYSGAVSRMDTKFTPVTVSGTMGVNEDASPDDETLGEGFGTFSSRSANRSLQRFSDAQKRMRTGLQTVYAYTVAKPFGQLKIEGELSPPHLSKIVLPVFDRSAIIPASLENPGSSPLADYNWSKFQLEYLPALGTVDSLDAMPEHLKRAHQWRHEMLKKLDDPAWRQQGLDWLNTPKWAKDPDDPDKLIQVGINEDDCTYWDGGGGSRHPSSLH